MTTFLYCLICFLCAAIGLLHLAEATAQFRASEKLQGDAKVGHLFIGVLLLSAAAFLIVSLWTGGPCK